MLDPNNADHRKWCQHNHGVWRWLAMIRLRGETHWEICASYFTREDAPNAARYYGAMCYPGDDVQWRVVDLKKHDLCRAKAPNDPLL